MEPLADAGRRPRPSRSSTATDFSQLVSLVSGLVPLSEALMIVVNNLGIHLEPDDLPGHVQVHALPVVDNRGGVAARRARRGHDATPPKAAPV